jgi:hypothetical protein
MLRAMNAMKKPDRDALLRETHRLNHELGYVGFRHQYLSDPDAVKQWPDPAVRERQLRSFWDKQWEGSYAAYHKDFARHSVNVLAAYYDHLRDLLAGDREDQIAYYHRFLEMGRSVRLSENSFGEPNAVKERSATPSEIVRENSTARTEQGNGHGHAWEVEGGRGH